MKTVMKLPSILGLIKIFSETFNNGEHLRTLFHPSSDPSILLKWETKNHKNKKI